MTYPPNKVSNFELAVLVLRFLETSGCTKTVTAFKREAKHIFSNQSPDALTGIKPLSDIVNEYLSLESQQRQRNQMAQTNLLAQSIYATLDHHAGITTQALSTSQQLYQSQTNSFLTYATQPAALQPFVIGVSGASTNPTLMPVSALNNHHNAHPPTQTTPGRHVQRKRALPRKKRKIDVAAESPPLIFPSQHQQYDVTQEGTTDFFPSSLDFTIGTGPGSQDLLNKTMTQDQIALLLTDLPLQSKFAEGLANQINQSDPNNLFDGLLTDPEITAVLQTLLATDDSPSTIGDISIDPGTVVRAGAKSKTPENTNERVLAVENDHVHDSKGIEIPMVDDGDAKRKKGKSGEDASVETGQKENDCLSSGKKDTPGVGGPAEGVGNVDDVIARFMSNPEQFENLIDECVG